MNRMTLVVLSAIAFLPGGCAQNPKEIQASYVSPIIYQSLTCEQLMAEAHRVSARAAEVTGTQQKKSTNDAVAMGVGLVVFWPALFFIKGDNQTAGELARLRGELDAIQQAATAKGCGLTIQTYE